jgi:ferredoxin-NADP reductase
MAPAQKLRCTVDSVVAHGDHVFTVTLRPERPAPRFLAGQFLHLALDAYDPTGFWPESRVFSIASAPSQRDLLRITYSVQGAFTARMEADLVPGREAWVKMPYGHFIIEPRGEVVLLAGGTGITAFTAFLEQFGTEENDCRVCLAYGARHEGLLVYRELVERSVARRERLTALYFLEHGTDSQAIAGRVALDPIWTGLMQPEEASYFIAGPPPMLTSLKTELGRRGVPAGAVHIDAWE